MLLNSFTCVSFFWVQLWDLFGCQVKSVWGRRYARFDFDFTCTMDIRSFAAHVKFN